MNLRFCLISARLDHGEKRHAQVVMKELGITYQHSTPQSLYEQWWFWNCENVPEIFPDFISELEVKPMDAIGRGLDEETALALQQQETR